MQKIGFNINFSTIFFTLKKIPPMLMHVCFLFFIQYYAFHLNNELFSNNEYFASKLRFAQMD